MKKIIWIGSSYDDLKEFPVPVRNAMVKTKLAMEIYEAIKTKKLTQAKAAKVIKISQPKVFLLFEAI